MTTLSKAANSFKTYGNSKYKKLKQFGITSNSVHPGLVSTPINVKYAEN